MSESENSYVLTHAQKRIWYTEKMNESTGFANIAGMIILPDTVDYLALEQAINQIIELYDGLRLQLYQSDGESELDAVRQSVADYRYRQLEKFQFPGSVELNEWAALQSRTPFVLLQADLFYFALFSLDENQGGFYFKIHHIVGDGWTGHVMVHQIIDCYHAITSGKGRLNWRESVLPEVTSYLEFITKEQDYLGSSTFQKDEMYWRELFTDIPDAVQLQVLPQRTIGATIEANRLFFQIPEDTKDALYEFCRQSRLTLYQVFLTALHIYITRVTEKYDSVIGIAYHGRSDRRSRRALGMFVSTLPIRIISSQDMDFVTVAKNIGRSLKEAVRHQQYPYDLLAQHLRQQGVSAEGLLHVNLVQVPDRRTMTGETATSNQFQPKVIAAGANPSQLTLYINPNSLEADGILELAIEYQTAVFTAQDIENIYQRFLCVLTDAILDSSKKITELTIMPEGEKQQLLVNFNNTYADFSFDKTVQELFYEQAQRFPDQLALVYQNERLTYRQLDQKTNQLARILRRKGVKPDTLVGIMVDRSADIVVGALAVIKAGGAYLPIDPAYPQERISYMLEDSQALLLLTQRHLVSKVGEYTKEWLAIEEPELYVAESDTSELSCVNQPQDLVYVIYTSGSTGKPKGVMIEHRNLVNLCFWRQQEDTITAEDNIALYFGFGFDPSVMMIFVSLLSGATLHILAEDIRLSPTQIEEYFSLNHITLSAMPTAFCEQFMEVADNHSLRSLGTGGDKLKAYYPHNYRLVNEYGPTEYTVMATYFPVERYYENIPIGKPVANTWLYVLDRQGQVQPSGVPGELCIAGAQMARGYLHRPELTAEKFVLNPYATCEMNSRMYKTGDLVRWLPDGMIEFLGRIDQQVKIRGYRIELGEIEQQLLRHEMVREAVVVDFTDKGGMKYLCAYIVTMEDGYREEGALKVFLLAELPDYMVPTYFIFLEKIPVTANGKIDKKALPTPESVDLSTSYTAPRNEMEEMLVVIWQELLMAKRVGIDDNFFALGGHSLKITVLATKVQKLFGVKIPIAELFTLTSIRVLSERIALLGKGKESQIESAALQKDYPLSSAQQRMYIMGQFEGGGSSYNIPFVTVLTGKLDGNRLENAFREIINRHEVLRTSFQTIGDQPRQLIAQQVEFKMERETAYGGIPAQNEIITWLQREFDLSHSPLLRVKLIKMTTDEHILLINIHHIVFDGMSFATFFKDLTALYLGQVPVPVRLQYKDFAVWHNALLESEAIREQEEYWLNNFAGELPILNIPLDYPRSTMRSFAGGMIHLTIEPQLCEALRQLATTQDATLYMVLLAVWQIVLAKYSGQEDIIVGTATSGRRHADVEDMIGMFVSTVALRAYPVGDKTFLLFLKEVKEKLLAGLENQDYPLERLVQKLGIVREAGRNPLFDVMFTMDNFETTLEFAGLKMEPYPLTSPIAKFDLTLSVVEKNTELLLHLEYAEKLFKPETIEQIGHHFITILRSITNQPKQQISEIAMLSRVEKQQLLHEFNQTFLPVVTSKTIQQLFVEQVKKTPNKIALVFQEERYTYQELHDTSNRLARCLREKGVKADTIVGIMVERSADIAIGALAVLKAGGAYLPIDPAYPDDRISYMLSDSQTLLLLTQQQLVSKVHDYSGACVVMEAEEHYSSDASDMPLINTAQDLCYIIYTSGSTGKPKGVMIEHRNLANLCAWRQHEDNITAADKVALYFGFGFDPSVMMIFTPLLAGAELHILAEEIRLSPVQIDEYFSRNQITLSAMPTAFCEQFMEVTDNRSLRSLGTGGDKLKAYYPRNYRLVNEYGPTEYTVMAAYFPVEQQYDNIPVGRPVANTWLYVVDRYQQLQPVGVLGELCIAGAQMARGYLNRPELTAEKFVANPYATSTVNQIMYKTGDLVRWLPNGTLEFGGRIDQQVKIRGYRIELGEIEQQLIRHQDIKEAVVLDRKDSNGIKYLCAYLVADKTLPVEEIRVFLEKDIPDYMVPSYFIFLDKIPLTANDKVDRRALPEPDLTAATALYSAPRNQVEEILAEVWQEILGIEQIGINDNFFSLGGDSIKAIQVIARLGRSQYKLEMKNIFQYPLLKELSRYVVPLGRIIDDSLVVGEIALTPIQHWFFKKDFTEKQHWNQSVLLYAKDGLQEEWVAQALNQLATHHDALRMVYQWEGDQITQSNRGLADGELCALQVKVITDETKCSVDIEQESAIVQQQMNLAKGPLLQAILFQCNGQSYLALMIHHLVVDGVSWRILVEDLHTAYEQAAQGRTLVLPAKSDSFKTWSEKLHTYAQSRALLQEIPYWRTIEEKKNQPLPVDDHKTGQVMMQDYEKMQFSLSEEITEQLLKQVNQAYHTEINDILLAAFSLAIRDWAYRDTVRINMEGHGREDIIEDIDITRTIGWFTSSYPVVLELKYPNNIGYTIKSIKETVRRIPNKGIGFGILKYVTLPEYREGLVYQPEPEIDFNYLGQFADNVTETAGHIVMERFSVGNDMSPKTPLAAKLSISGMIMGGKLAITINYSRRHYREDTITKLLTCYERQLLTIIEHCSAIAQVQYTPSDFGDAALTLEELEGIYQQLGQNVQSIYPLTPMQEGMLFVSLRDSSSSAHFIQMVDEISGMLDVGLFAEQFQRVVARHDILRTAILYEGLERPRQVVLKGRKGLLHFEDISARLPVDQEKYIRQFLKKDREQGFDLKSEPLFRLALLKTKPETHLLVMSFHHVILDGWCQGILNRELFGDYLQIKQQHPLLEEPAPVYRSYLEWLERQDKEAAQNYWKQYVAGVEQQTSLPGKRIGNDHSRHEIGFMDLSIESSLTQRLLAVAQQYQVITSILLQAVWGILLQRYNNQEDVVFGSVISGRKPEIPDVENMLGLFINTIPVRVQCSPKMSFAELLLQLQAASLESERYDYFPLADIQAGSMLKSGLIGHLVNSQRFTRSDEEGTRVGELCVKTIAGFEHTNYDFVLRFLTGDEIGIRFTYNAALYDSSMIARMKSHFVRVLEQVSVTPTMQITEIDLLSQEEREILLFECNNDTQRKAVASWQALFFDNREILIPTAKEESMYPLSSAQTRMYLLMQNQGAGKVYNTTQALLIEGRLDKERLGRVIDSLIDRHESLRTSFTLLDHGVVQKIHRQVKYKKNYRESKEQIGQELIKEYAHEYELTKTPLFRVEIVELSKDKRLLLWDASHMIFDSYSLQIIQRELLAYYEGRELPEIQLRYRDYAVWQKEFLDTEIMKRQEAYWLSVLSEYPSAIELPFDYPRTLVPNYTGNTVEVSLSVEQTQLVKEIAEKLHISLEAVLLAAYIQLLSVYGKQNDVIVGCLVNGRSQLELTDIVGMFENLLPLRTQIDETSTFYELALQVGQNLEKAFENQDWPFDRLVEVLSPKRTLGQTPFFDVVFKWSPRNTQISNGEVTVSMYETQAETVQFDLVLEAWEQEGQVHLDFSYRTALFTIKTVEEMSRNLAFILEQAITHPKQLLSSLELVIAGTSQKMLSIAKVMPSEFSLDTTLTQCFEEIVMKQPEKIALIDRQQQYTYQEINRRANQLGRLLRKKGIQQESIVALLAKHSCDFVVGALAILKAGGASVVLDPTDSAERILATLDDSQAALLVTERQLVGKIEEYQGEWVAIDETESIVDEDSNLPLMNKPKDLVYIIYSSGNNNGVMIEHHNLVNLCRWRQRENTITAADTMALSFGLTEKYFSMMFTGLLSGATLHSVPEDICLSPVKIDEYFSDNHITVPFISHEYGFAEYTMVAIQFMAQRNYNHMPIGKPVANTWAYVVDRDCNLQPLGIPGELCIAGAQLARGYLGQAELTAEKFVKNPHATQPLNERMYKTGDLVRWLPDGNLEFLSRKSEVQEYTEFHNAGTEAIPYTLDSSEQYVDSGTAAEEKIAKVWREVLGIEKVSIHDNFFSLGGHSIKAITVVARLLRYFEISIQDLFEHQTIAELVPFIRPRQDYLKIKLAELAERTTILDQGVRIQDPVLLENLAQCQQEYERANEKYQMMNVKQQSYQTILLTGATGYLGIHLLHDLLQEKDCHIYLIIRAETVQQATARLLSKLGYYFGWDAAEWQNSATRITILTGDLKNENIGLESAVYAQLVNEVDCIIHAAANVRHYGHYQEFYEDNVLATINLLEVAKQGQRKDFHYISTLAIGVEKMIGRDFAVFTEYDKETEQQSSNNYVRTKYEAEQAVILARTEGVNGTIYRVGNIVFHSKNGIFQENIEENAFYAQLQSFITIGLVPANFPVEFSYVDKVSQAVLKLVYAKTLKNEIHHIHNPQQVQLAEFLTNPILELGVQRVEYGEFIDYLYRHYDKPGFKEHIERSMLHFGWLEEGINETSLTPIVWSDKTDFILDQLGFSWPMPEPAPMALMIRQILRERIEFLQQTPLFTTLSSDKLLLLAGHARQKLYVDGSDILWEGETNVDFYLIIEGFAEVSRSTSGGWQGTVGVVSTNEFLGEEALFEEASSSLTAESIMGDVLVLAIPIELMKQLLDVDCTLANNLLRAMNTRLRRMEKMFVSIG